MVSLTWFMNLKTPENDNYIYSLHAADNEVQTS